MFDKLINADILMYIPNDGKQNYSFCRFQLVVETKLNAPINQKSPQSCEAKVEEHIIVQIVSSNLE